MSVEQLMCLNNNRILGKDLADIKEYSQLVNSV